jgi:hypothetical protein
MSTATDVEAMNKPTPVESLGDAVRVFFKYPSPWLIYGTAAVTLAVRIAWGGWSWWDLGVAAAILAFWPVQEWLIHVFILHFKPVEIFGRTFDLHVADEHRKHHREPWVLRLVFVPTRTVVTGLVVGVPPYLLIAWAWLPWSTALTALATFFVFGSIYEWTHFLIHTAYKPKTRWYRKLWKHHRLHHFKNEQYWYGVSRTGGDWLLGTAPEPNEVEKSTSVRDIV